MNMRLLKIIFLLAISNYLIAQDFTLQFTIERLPDGWVYLSGYHRKAYQLLDSCKSANGTFYFTKGLAMPDGMFRLDFQRPGSRSQAQDSPFIEFIWGRESFNISADYINVPATVIIDNSAENSVLEDFRAQEALYNQKINALIPFIDRYPDGDELYTEAVEMFEQIQEQRDSYITMLSEDNSKLFVSKLLQAYRSKHLPATLKGDERIEYIRKHFFDLAPIYDPALLNAPIYTSKIIEFLSLFREQGASFAQQEDRFIEAVDMIMASVSGDNEIRSFVVDYLLEGFESFGMEKIQTYIVDTYLDETCETDAAELAKLRVEGYRAMAVGKTAPDILIRDRFNKMIRLSDVDSDYVLVVFWASYCEHCMKMFSKLHEWYDTERPANMEMFTVSIDTVKAAWENFNNRVNPPWISTHEPLGWEGKSAEDYNLYATPTMFLLDRNRKILAKPLNVRELMKEVERLGF